MGSWFSNDDKNESLRKQLKDLQRKYQQCIKQIQHLKKDLESFEKADKLLFDNFLSQLKTWNVGNAISKGNDFRYLGIMGQTSAGKSSLLNKFLGLNLQVGIDDTTQQIKKVHVDYKEKIAYFDSPGLNQAISVTNADVLKAFYSINIMIIATSTTFKNSIRAIKVMIKINPPLLVLVRSQCDKFSTESEMKSCMEKDRKVVTQCGYDKPILYVSAHKGLQFKDNRKLQQILKGKSTIK